MAKYSDSKGVVVSIHKGDGEEELHSFMTTADYSAAERASHFLHERGYKPDTDQMRWGDAQYNIALVYPMA